MAVHQFPADRGSSCKPLLALFCAAVAFMAASLHTCRADTLTTLYSFSGSADGLSPNGLIQASDGNLYGTTAGGGPNLDGTIFKITTDGTLTTLYSFSAQNPIKNSDGANPYDSLLQASDGDLYGTTNNGGANGQGTVFKITTGGAFTTLYSFNSYSDTNPDGNDPYAALIQASDGNLYSTTYGGGANNTGTIFKITTGGALTTLCAFSGADGALPSAAPIQAKDGNFYGTTRGGTTSGNGVIYKVTPGGVLTMLYAFSGGADGAYPRAALIQASDGNLYGTTAYDYYSAGLGGSSPTGNGTVFKITTDGKFTTLHHFQGYDGTNPFGALIQASDGYLYGTTYQGGAYNTGTIFRIAADGTFTTIHSFGAIPNRINNINPHGAYPDAALIQAADGNLYGTTAGGGANGHGTVFKLQIGQTPPILDFNGDGKPDILWQNVVTGDLNYWLMNGAQYSGQWGSIWSALPLEWKVVGTPDLDGDGQADILWQNRITGQVTYWIMNGTTFTGNYGTITPAVTPDWQIVGTPDLNGDGCADILWQNRITGQVTYWLMNWMGFSGTSGIITPAVTPDWKVVGTPDLNGDGQADILWQNQKTGAVTYWIMNGTQFSGISGTIGPNVTPDWKVVGTPDLNGDGQADILWQNQKTGAVAYWLLNGIQFTGAAGTYGAILQGMPLQWKIVSSH